MGQGKAAGRLFANRLHKIMLKMIDKYKHTKTQAHKERQNNTQITKTNTNSKQKYTSNTDLLPTIFLGAYIICNRQEKFYHLGHRQIEVKLFLWTI